MKSEPGGLQQLLVRLLLGRRNHDLPQQMKHLQQECPKMTSQTAAPRLIVVTLAPFRHFEKHYKALKNN
jgi:hypothetical protein